MSLPRLLARVVPWDKEVAVAAIESGVEALWVPDGRASSARELGRVVTACAEGDLREGTDFRVTRVEGKEDETRIAGSPRTRRGSSSRATGRSSPSRTSWPGGAGFWSWPGRPPMSLSTGVSWKSFGPVLAQPYTFLLGAAGQFGIFLTLLLALFMGFPKLDAVSIGVIGACDGPTAIYVTSKYAPHLLGAVAVAAYSYMALVPVIQPPIMRALTTDKEGRRRP